MTIKHAYVRAILAGVLPLAILDDGAGASEPPADWVALPSGSGSVVVELYHGGTNRTYTVGGDGVNYWEVPEQIRKVVSTTETSVIVGTGTPSAKYEAIGAVIFKREIRIQESDLTDAVNGEAQVINIGAALPANAIVLGHQVKVDTLFSGGSASAVKLDVGGTVADAIVKQQDVFTGAATGALSPRTGSQAQGKFSAQQLAAKFTPDAGHTLLGLTAGDLTITVWYSILA